MIEITASPSLRAVIVRPECIASRECQHRRILASNIGIACGSHVVGRSCAALR